MLENLINLVQEHAGQAIINNPAIPNEKNDAAVQAASDSITGGLQQALSQGGGIQQVLQLFSGQQDIQENPVTKQISGGFVQNLVGQLGIDQQAAGGIAGGLIPDVMKKLVNKTNDPGDSSFDIQGLFNSISGGKTSGINLQGLLDKVKKGGFDLDGDGDTDLQDLMAAFGAGGGGVVNKIKGLFN